MEQQSDHDLLIRISEQLVQLRLTLDGERAAWNARAAKHDVELEGLKKDVESLRISRGTIYGMTITLSAIVSALVKLLWK